MSCKIERLLTSNNSVVLRVSGGIDGDHIETLKDVLGREKGEIVLDLTEVNFVDRDAVKFLAASEADGILIRNCPEYVREWVARVRPSIDQPSRTRGEEN
jgi:hypothetical protein